MTRLISPKFPHSLKQAEAGLDRIDLLTKVDDMSSRQDLDTLHPRESLIDFTATRFIDSPKLSFNNSDTDDDDHNPNLPTSLLSNAQRKRVQNALFEDFVREKDESHLREVSEDPNSPMGLLDDTNSKDAANARRIIDCVRDYQSELFARAKAGNIIAVLDTGTGKTLIAALLLREVVTKEMDNRASGKSPRTSFFLVRHFWCLYILSTDVKLCCRQTVLLLQNSSTKCFARTWPQCQL